MKEERVFWGVFLIIGAVFLIVGKLGYLGGFSVLSLLLTIFFAACFVKGVLHKSVWGILFSIAFLCIIYEKPLGITEITPWPILAAAFLGSIGFSLLYRPKHKKMKCYYNGKETVETFAEEQIEFATTFGEGIKYVNSDDLQQVNLKCSFGSMKVYFDNAIIQNGQAVIHLDVSFAGTELYIPKEWNVVNKANVSFGAIEEKNRNGSAGTPVVTLIGSVSFAGVEIIYI